jgi:hypothetical protein
MKTVDIKFLQKKYKESPGIITLTRHEYHETVKLFGSTPFKQFFNKLKYTNYTSIKSIKHTIYALLMGYRDVSYKGKPIRVATIISRFFYKD